MLLCVSRLCFSSQVQNQDSASGRKALGNSNAAMQLFEYRPVRYLSKEINGTLPGGGKKYFLIRVIDGPTMTAASMATCRFVAPRSPWSRLGSELDMVSRLQRMRGRFHRWMQIKTGPQQFEDNCHDPPKFWIQTSLEGPKRRRMRFRRLPDPRPIPEGVREPICPRKK